MKKWTSSEYQECRAFFQWAQLNPITKEYLIKIVNEGKRSAVNTYFLKQIGLRSGLPDYFFPVSNIKYRGLWLEMKKKDEMNRKKRENQTEWIEKLKKVGHYATYCYGSDDAIRILTDYINNKL